MDTVDVTMSDTSPTTAKSRLWSLFPAFGTPTKPSQGTDVRENSTSHKRSATEFGADAHSSTSLLSLVKRSRRAEAVIEPIDSSEDDDEPVAPVVLNWRTHPELSDWTIDVVSLGTNTSERYAVHKSVISLESKYFAGLFASKGSKESSSRFEFPSEAAALFPTLLDFMYAPSKLVLTTETAAIYYYFGQVFSMTRLRWEAKQFWTLDLSLETIASYYQQAIVLDNRKLLAAVGTACAKESVFLELTKDSALLNVPRVDVWLDLVSMVGPHHSKHVSVLMATFCQKHAAVVDEPTFRELWRADLVPEIDASVAFDVLDLECVIQRANGTTSTGLSSLQDRCITALEETWATMDLSERHVDALLRRQSPDFLVTLAQRTLQAAQKSTGATVQSCDFPPLFEAKQTIPFGACTGQSGTSESELLSLCEDE